MSAPDPRETAPTTRRDAQWPSFVAASTAFAAWAVQRHLFHGQAPVEAVGVIQYGVPLALGWIAGEVRWRTARRRGTPVPSQDAEAD